MEEESERMAQRRRNGVFVSCMTLWLAGGCLIGAGGCLPGAQAQRAAPPQQIPQKTTPLPDTTTQERLVNPTGLTETAPNGWHTDFIGPFRGDFDASFGIKFWPDRFNLRNLIFSSTVDLLPGLRARGQVRRREGERQAFQLDTDEASLELFDP